MVVITAAAGYAVAPGVLELSTLVCCSAGTALQSAAANSINQVLCCCRFV
jgi:heme O synthase-like polyprenyltransferase